MSSSTLATSPLVRLLAQWAPRPASAPADLAQGLGQWVTAFDAIGLQAAHSAIRTMAADAAGAARGLPPAAQELAAELERTRAALAAAILQDAALPNETTYAPFRRRHLELQRRMEQAVGALRERVRQALARGAPAQRQLAVLDAALERITARREQAILPAAAALLERRFQQLRRAHLKDVEARGGEDDPAAWHRPGGGWLHAFQADWHRAVLAELALRLQPVAGLVEACGIELNDD